MKKKKEDIIIPKFNEKDFLPYVKDGTVKQRKKHVDNTILSKGGMSFWNRRKLKKKPDQAFLIRMLFSNGTSREFVIVTSKETFTYKKREYYLRYEDCYFNLTQNQYELTYFDDYAVPIDRRIQLIGDKAYFSVTSSNLKPLIEMKYIKTLANAQELDKYLKMTALISGFVLIAILVLMYQVLRISKFIGAGG